MVEEQNTAILMSGVYMQEGHTVQFTIINCDEIEITEFLEGAFKTHKTTLVCGALEAFKKQEALMKFGYTRL